MKAFTSPTGLYSYKNSVYYITTTSPDDYLVGKKLYRGTHIAGYSSMIRIHAKVYAIFTPLIPGWLPNDCIPSDIYPELFI